MLAILVSTVALIGCISPPRRAVASRPEADALQRLEAQLDELTTTLEALSRRLDELDTRTRALGDELTRARRQAPLAPLRLEPVPTSPKVAPTGEPAREFEVAEITLGMLTGAANWDGEPGDDGVLVYLYPLDDSGDILKRAGDFTFELFDLRRRSSHVVASWHIAALETADLWLNFPGCFRFKLAWPESPPTSAELVLKATFVTLSGREFVATKTLRVEPAPETAAAE